jgi:zinc protease
MRRDNALWMLALCAALCAAGCKTTPEPVPEPKVAAPPPAPVSAEAWRKTQPTPGDAPELVIPTFQRATLKNGMTLMVSERRDLPLVSMGVALAAGSAQDPRGKAGLADLTHRTLLEGAGKKDAIALEEAFAELGGAPFVGTQYDGALVGTRVLRRNAPEALGLLADIVLRPMLRPEDFDRRRKEHLDTLARQIGTPGFLAQWAFANVLYGAEHPYGHLVGGTPQSVSTLTAKDARAFWNRHAGPRAAALVITGDVTMKEAQEWAEKHFGGWKGDAQRPPKPPELGARAAPQRVLVPKAGLVQTVVAMGRPAIEAGHPDEAALELATTIFGGMFGSRLNMNLREAKGYTYGASSYVSARRGEGPLVASSSVRADVTGPSVQEFLNELRGLKERPITEAELNDARQGLIQSLPGSFKTVDALARAAAAIWLEEKDLDHHQKLVARLEAATPAQVQAAAERYFDPQSLSLVLVGDPEVVKAQLEPLKLGELTLRPPPELPAGAVGAKAKGK